MWKLHFILVSRWVFIHLFFNQNLEPTCCAGVALGFHLILQVSPKPGTYTLCWCRTGPRVDIGTYTLRLCGSGSWFDVGVGPKSGSCALCWCRVGSWFDVGGLPKTWTLHCAMVSHWVLIWFWSFDQHLKQTLCAGVAMGPWFEIEISTETWS